MESIVYITNKKDMVLKEGQTFKKNTIVAKNSSYFLGDNPSDITYSYGKLCKVAITSGDFTFIQGL